MDADVKEEQADGVQLQIEYDFPLLPEDSSVSAPSTSAGDNFYYCEFCDYKTKQPCHLQSHVRCHTGEKPYTCELCDYASARKKDLKSHMTVHTGEKPFACDQCNYRTATKVNLKRHMRTHSGEKPFACEQCKYKTGDQSALINHMRIHSNDRAWCCELCGYRAVRRAHLLRHMRSHTGEHPFACDVCDYSTGDKDVLNRHKKVHLANDKKPFSCDMCDFKSTSQDSLKRHIRKAHRDDDPSLLACDYCQYKTEFNGRLMSHVRRIHMMGEKSFGCHSCSFRTYARRSLVRHMKTHSGKLLECDSCDFKSNNHSSLRAHKKKHSEGTYVRCKSFSKQSESKRYECDKCDYKSNDHSNMRTHKKKHVEGRELFLCEECDFKTIYKTSLLRHAESHHVDVKTVDELKEAIGAHRIVHLDLKGAAPKVSYLAQLFPFIKKLGATGILMEYEDTFPYSSFDISGSDAYSRNEIGQILRLANESKLTVIPLIQTFGHLEFALKLESFKHLREHLRFPQAICPSKNESMKLIYGMIDDIMDAHRGIQYLHIGCDEVYQLATCDDCRAKMMAEAWSPQEVFLHHVMVVSEYIKKKYPSVSVLIWDDMLRHIPYETISLFHLERLVEPVVWKYTEDVESSLPESLWGKYVKLFPHLWFASAFKGAKSPDSITNSISNYLSNHRSWVKLISKYAKTTRFRGAILTGWQRYDHFAVLCELLPVSIPSLAVNLIYLSSESKSDLLAVTSEAQTQCKCDTNPVLTLNNNILVRCSFPGSHLFQAVSHFEHTLSRIQEAKSTNYFKGWFSSFNRNHSFSQPSYVEEAANELISCYSTIISLEKEIEEAMEQVYKPDTFAEWRSTYILPVKEELKTYVHARDRMLAVESWPKRPLE